MEFANLLSRVAEQLLADELTVRGADVRLPDKDMIYKIRHKYEFGENKLAISIEWLDS